MAYLKFIRLVEFVEVRFNIDGLPERLQEETLEGHNFPDVTEEGRDLCRGKEGGSPQGLQVIVQQVVQVLEVK